MFQTRSEENGIRNFGTIDEAHAAADLDPTIWKISFTTLDGHPMRLVRQPDNTWRNEPIVVKAFIPDWVL
jgi:hypothetical protein